MIGGWIADVLDDIGNAAVQADVKAKAAELAGKFLVP